MHPSRLPQYILSVEKHNDFLNDANSPNVCYAYAHGWGLDHLHLLASFANNVYSQGLVEQVIANDLNVLQMTKPISYRPT